MDIITDPKALFRLLKLNEPIHIPAHFKLRVPRSFVKRMEKGNPRDPLLLQILPVKEEEIEHPDFSPHALQEDKFNPIPGLLHKYHGRVLVMPAVSCAVNCRYCLRREFAYNENNMGRSGWDKIIDYLQADSTITEIILSGGDPLVAKDDLLKAFIDKILTVPHIKTLRIHTRIPIVMPERITKEFIGFMKQIPLRKIMVVHANHPNELDISIKKAMTKLKRAGFTLLNQSALLKNINDGSETLIQLSEKLFDCGILPYYLNVLDKVRGTSHFDVPDETAKKLIKIMREKLPGYLVPKLVREVPGEKHKMPL
ncbi:MAG TPA: EF-P beta-lysylation protein EpmB [Gammaproteobacteria bacterium]|nr:EF-P beta-lysylation protein EpmB [Gammaproteobacteria bacterium]